MQFLSSPSTGLRPWLIRALLTLPLTLVACREQAPVILTRFNAFGAQVDISLVGVTPEQAKQASAILAQDFALLERDWTPQSSSMRRVNRLLASGQPFVAPPSILPLTQMGKSLETQSQGLYTPATGALTRLWGFDQGSLQDHPPPTADQIARLVEAAPRMEQLSVDGLTLAGANPALSLDFSVIARSNAIDLAIQHLKDLGVRNALVQVNGELRAIGERSGQPWRVPLLRPSGSGVLAILPIRGDESVVTAAEYNRYFIFKGRRYHAIIDPRTGWPANASRSVTVLHHDATGAAAAATALFIAGPKEWPSIAERMGVEHVLLIDLEGRLHMSRAMADRVELVDRHELTETLAPAAEADTPGLPRATPR